MLHDHVPVDAENALAHLHLVIQEFSYILAGLQQENVGRVGQEHLRRGRRNKVEQTARHKDEAGDGWNAVTSEYFKKQ